MLPEECPGDLERSRWSNAPQGLTGVVLSSEEELRALLQKSGGTGRFFTEEARGVTGKGYIKYCQTSSSGLSASPVAYQCGSCHKIVVGAPEIKDDNSIASGIPLGGRKGFDVYCTQCSQLMASYTFELS